MDSCENTDFKSTDGIILTCFRFKKSQDYQKSTSYLNSTSSHLANKNKLTHCLVVVVVKCLYFRKSMIEAYFPQILNVINIINTVIYDD